MRASFSKSEAAAPVLSQRRIEAQRFFVLIVCHVGELIKAKAKRFLAQFKEQVMFLNFFKV